LIPSPLPPAAMAARNEPVPLSFRLATVKVLLQLFLEENRFAGKKSAHPTPRIHCPGCAPHTSDRATCTRRNNQPLETFGL
jgi:hypothetical protein